MHKHLLAIRPPIGHHPDSVRRINSCPYSPYHFGSFDDGNFIEKTTDHNIAYRALRIDVHLLPIRATANVNAISGGDCVYSMLNRFESRRGTGAAVAGAVRAI